jgi:superfamily II DNA/RNA helicase
MTSTSTPSTTLPAFRELGVPAVLVQALAGQGINTPMPIQAATLPDSLAGRDVLGRGRTGSGKTIAFAVPTVAALQASGRKPRPGSPRALVLVPTRELANQVALTFAPLAHVAGMKIATIYGGVGQNPQVKALERGLDVVIACPGRLEDLIRQGHCSLGDVEVSVLDEADHMADLGFLPGVKRLLGLTPADGQRMFFSATLDQGVDSLVKRFLTSPVTHSVHAPVAAVSTMDHHMFTVAHADKTAVVHQLAGGHGRALLFTRTKHTAKRLAGQLSAAGVPALDLHGNLSQNARERNLRAFSSGQVRVLVATDIAARGIHVDGIELVVHVDPPAEHKAYLHRSGRTARAGASGKVVTLITPDQQGDVRLLAKKAGIAAMLQPVSAGHAAIEALTGPEAPRVDASTVPALAERPAAQPRRKAGTSSRSAGNGGRSSHAGRSGHGGGAASGGARSGSPRRSGGAGAGSSGPRRSGAAAPARTSSAASFSERGSSRRRRSA